MPDHQRQPVTLMQDPSTRSLYVAVNGVLHNITDRPQDLTPQGAMLMAARCPPGHRPAVSPSQPGPPNRTPRTS